MFKIPITEEIEHKIIEAALKKHSASCTIAQIAQELGCSPRTLWRRIKKYGIILNYDDWPHYTPTPQPKVILHGK